MAGNLSGMFAQLNAAIGQNPMAKGGSAQGLLDTGMMHMGNMAGEATGKDPYDFMGQGSQTMAAQEGNEGPQHGYVSRAG